MNQTMFLMALGLDPLTEAAPKKELGQLQMRGERSGLQPRYSL